LNAKARRFKEYYSSAVKAKLAEKKIYQNTQTTSTSQKKVFFVFSIAPEIASTLLKPSFIRIEAKVLKVKKCDFDEIFDSFLRQKRPVPTLCNTVEIDSEFWERDFVLSLGSENRRSVDISRLFKVQNED
jgi:hypothetical protein